MLNLYLCFFHVVNPVAYYTITWILKKKIFLYYKEEKGKLSNLKDASKQKTTHIKNSKKNMQYLVLF